MRNLIYNTVNQIDQRALHLPKGTTQIIAIDITGQGVDAELLMSIRKSILDKSSCRVKVDFYDLR